MRKQFAWGGLAILSLLQGCGVTLDSRRVTTDKVPPIIPGEGIVYALPKTQFLVEQTVKLKVPGGGKLHAVYDACKRACEADTNAVCKFDTNPSMEFFPPVLKTAAVPDAQRLYQISPEAELFQSIDFKFEIAANGVLDKADSSVTNNAYEVVGAAVGTAIKIAALAKSSAKTTEEKMASNSTDLAKCEKTSRDVAGLPEAGKQNLCPMLKTISTCLETVETKVEKERVALNLLFDSASSAKMDPTLLAALAANRKDRIDAAVALREVEASRYGLGEGQPSEAIFQVLIPVMSPPEFTSMTGAVSMAGAFSDGSARVAGLSENAAGQLSKFIGLARLEPRTYKVSTDMPSAVRAKGTDDVEPERSGYRYRVPMLAQTSLTVYKNSAMNVAEIEAGPFMDLKVIAQYGPIASLPSRFKGKKGRLMVKHWPEFGGLQTVELGGEGIPSSAVTGLMDETFSQYKARTDKSEAAATAAAGVDVELDTLTRQQKVLTLQKQIKELQDQLKN